MKILCIKETKHSDGKITITIETKNKGDYYHTFSNTKMIEDYFNMEPSEDELSTSSVFGRLIIKQVLNSNGVYPSQIIF